MPRISERKLLRLTRAALSVNGAGRPRILTLQVDRVDGVVTDLTPNGRTQIVLMDGSAVYVRENPDAVLRACEALGHPVGIFDKEGAKEAMRDCLE
jgi:hypothetical protein